MTRKSFLNALWVLLLCLLPFTSLPIASKILGSEMVAAPSIFPVILMGILWLVSAIFENNFKEISLPLLIFLVYCIAGSIITLFLGIPIQKDFNFVRSIVEVYITLLIGLAFFIVPLHYLKTRQQAIIAAKIVYWTFLPIFIWCGLQFGLERISNGYPAWMEALQQGFSTSGLLYPGRVTGFAYEPSWLAHQLNILYIPLFFGPTLAGFSLYKKKFWIFSVENILLAGSILLLFLTKSRIGWTSFAFCAFYGLLILYKKMVVKLRVRFSALNRKIWKLILPLVTSAAVIGIIFSGLFVSSKVDPRMELLFKAETYQNRNLLSVANDFFFAERILYWQTGWEIFNDHPILGVGLGNFGFYFQDYMPDFATALDEPRELLFRAGYQANNKNLWTRLLSETGMIGFLIFVAWLIVLWFHSSELVKTEDKAGKSWGYITKIALIALLFEGFSVDSFALPYYWLILGMSSAAFLVFKNDQLEVVR
jgi:O-antigen ligase